MFTPVLERLTRNTRLAAMLTALAAYPALAFQTRPPDGLLEMLGTVMPAFEVGVLGGFVALALDGDAPTLPRAALRYLVWLGMGLAAIWLVDALTRAGITAYVRFGAPPVYEAPL